MDSPLWPWPQPSSSSDSQHSMGSTSGIFDEAEDCLESSENKTPCNSLRELLDNCERSVASNLLDDEKQCLRCNLGDALATDFFGETINHAVIHPTFVAKFPRGRELCLEALRGQQLQQTKACRSWVFALHTIETKSGFDRYG